MIDKIVSDARAAVADVRDSATVLVGGFGSAGAPTALLDALTDRHLTGLTVVANNAGTGTTGLAALIESGAVSKVVCSFPRSADSTAFENRYRAGQIELELVPQGTLAERIRAGGAGIGGFYTRTGANTVLAEGREQRTIDGQDYLFEYPIRGDIAILRAFQSDRWGNLTYRRTARNFSPAMASAAIKTIVQAEEVVPLGTIDPEAVVTPGVFVDRVVEISR